MNLELTEEQEMIRSFARGFLEKECPKSLVREMEADEQGYSFELWIEMANLGWMGFALPEQYGGAGSTFLDLCLMVEEQGRYLLPSPFFHTAVLCASAIAEFGTDAQKDTYLSDIAAGKRVMAYAQTEPAASWRASGINLQATPDGDGYSLRKCHVITCPIMWYS